MIKINKGKCFQQAVDAVEEFLRKAKGKDQAASHSSTEEKNRHGSREDRSRPATGDEKCRAGTAEGKVKKSPVEGKRSVSSGSSERGSRSPLKRSQEQSPRKRGRPPKDEKDLTIPESSTVKGLVAGFKWPPSVVSEPGKGSDPHFHHFLLSQTEKPVVCYQAITKKLKVCEEETGSTSIQAADSTAVNGSITPTDKKIGFWGLGLMGSGIVSNLLKMGHTVTVWSRTAEKCDLFIQEGARLGRTPAEVVSTCDITFTCVSDPKAAKDALARLGCLSPGDSQLGPRADCPKYGSGIRIGQVLGSGLSMAPPGVSISQIAFLERVVSRNEYMLGGRGPGLDLDSADRDPRKSSIISSSVSPAEKDCEIMDDLEKQSAATNSLHHWKSPDNLWNNVFFPLQNKTVVNLCVTCESTVPDPYKINEKLLLEQGKRK
ncbi:LOW QUALITY PROTEIN: putative oxidoreductase GLYR1 [Tachyglossus aculeatus]|uniref:LOW QUALITY PROTEIN: putative oxidoreductase GLYR1 n=1 Tax=Tachyglossus aculeatus TaxID=9261 RepID=UPI0018F3980D|nr:LOW QUALITY PROTEIN: putative oxidoreductase GLYR1 [Tachyglossus aculeatus]